MRFNTFHIKVPVIFTQADIQRLLRDNIAPACRVMTEDEVELKRIWEQNGGKNEDLEATVWSVWKDVEQWGTGEQKRLAKLGREWIRLIEDNPTLDFKDFEDEPAYREMRTLREAKTDPLHLFGAREPQHQDPVLRGVCADHGREREGAKVSGLAAEQYVDHLKIAVYHLLERYGEYARVGTSATNPDAIYIRDFCSRFGIEPYTREHLDLKRKIENEIMDEKEKAAK